MDGVSDLFQYIRFFCCLDYIISLLQYSQIIKSLAITAVTCMTDVLASLNHFNYRTNLIVAVVSKVNHGGDKIEVNYHLR